MLGLYLHIPFCSSICGYCNFNRGLFDEGLKARYVDALVAEIRRDGSGRRADTIFFGGGTPSLLEPTEVARILAACAEAFDLASDVEVTLETNPETVTRERFDGFLEAGVNRFSIGVQSLDDEELRRLDRIHSAERARDAVRLARQAGVANLSLDLMLWLPGQSPASWARTVDEAIALGPDHLSFYLLELYPNAPLKEAMARARSTDGPDAAHWAQVADDDAADMYLDGLARMDAAGLHQYEISNAARSGRQSRHNVKYWQGGEWHGFGCGAHSTVGQERWRNVSATADYIARMAEGRAVATDRRVMSLDEQVSEALFMGLRLTAGIDGRNFLARFGVEPWSRYEHALRPHVGDGLIWRHAPVFGLTRQGMLVANEVLATFV